MPTANFIRVDLDLIEPGFRSKLFELIAACNARGAEYVATRGYSTYGAQMALWAKGRTTPGQKVTNAQGGHSAHNFGVAMDFVLDKSPMSGLQPDWSKDAFTIITEEAIKAGLHTGADYGDAPHISLPTYVTSADMAPLRAAWDASEKKEPVTLARLQEVWKVIKP